MARIPVTVCDECNRVGEPTHTYTITRDGGTKVSLDLCGEHGEDLELCIEKAIGRQQPAKRAPRKASQGGASPGGRAKLQVTSLADIEKMKRK